MRALKITQRFGQVVVETSAGVRASGSSVQSAIAKLDLTGFSSQSDYDGIARIFERIPDGDDGGQIGRGQAAA